MSQDLEPLTAGVGVGVSRFALTKEQLSHVTQLEPFLTVTVHASDASAASAGSEEARGRESHPFPVRFQGDVHKEGTSKS